MKSFDWTSIRTDERMVAGSDGEPTFSRDAEFCLALAYANTYHIGMSSLALHRVYELVCQTPRWTCERFFTNGEETPRSIETNAPLSAFGCVAFSVSFEEDYTNLLQMLHRSRIPLRRCQRGTDDPLIIMGGACAAINPLTMAEFIDVFALGAAENLLPTLLSSLEEDASREAVLERLAEEPGFFVPEHHRPEESSDQEKLLKLELSEEQMRLPGHLPTTAIVTPHTEFSEKFLIEMSRGCPEKCRYCWATFGMGVFRWHPTEYILGSLDRARAVTDQLGFVATAVGDHPEIERILEEADRMGFRSSVSSIRIPAVTDRVLRSLRSSGDRSITLAPETGSDVLRAKMGKPVTNSMLLEKIRMIFSHGFTQLKLYFLIGLPDETLDDVRAIVELTAEARAIMLETARKTGVIGHVHVGANVLVPKPFTPWQREPLDDRASLKHKIKLLRKGLLRLPNVSMGSVSIRQALWQTYITRAGRGAAPALEAMAGGQPLGSVLRAFENQIEPEVYHRLEGDLRWHFMRAAPAAARAAPAVTRASEPVVAVR